MNSLARWLLLSALEGGLQLLRRACHETPGHRGPVAADRALAAASAPTPLPLPGPQALGLSPGLDRHPVRPQDRHRLGRLARRVGLRLRQDLPPLPPRLAPRRRLAATACPAASRTQRG